MLASESDTGQQQTLYQLDAATGAAGPAISGRRTVPAAVATCYCCCCCSFLVLVAVTIIAFLITGSTCIEVTLGEEEQGVCQPFRAVFGRVLVHSAPAVATSYLLKPGRLELVGNNTRSFSLSCTVSPARYFPMPFVFVEGSSVSMNVTTSRAGPGLGDVDVSLLLLDYDNFLRYKNGRVFEAMPGTPSPHSGPIFRATLEAPRYGQYFVVLENLDVVDARGDWNLTVRRMSYDVSKAIGMCKEMPTCAFDVSSGETIITSAPRASDELQNVSIEVQAVSLFTTGFRATIFATLASVLLVISVVTCVIGCCCYRSAGRPQPTMPSYIPVTLPLLPSPPPSPHFDASAPPPVDQTTSVLRRQTSMAADASTSPGTPTISISGSAVIIN